MGTGAPDTADSGPEVGETTANGAEDTGHSGDGGDTREAAAVSEAAEIKFALEAEVTPAFEEVDLDTGSSADNSTTEDTEGYCHDDSVLDSIKNADRAIEHDRDPGLGEDDLPTPAPAPSMPPEPIARSQSRISNASSKGSKTDAARMSYSMLGCLTGTLTGISRHTWSTYLSNASSILCMGFSVFTWVHYSSSYPLMLAEYSVSTFNVW